MPELKVCRVCLNKDVTMYKYDRFQLKCFYEEIMAEKIDHRDGLPQCFCYECATMLYKFHKFKEKCKIGQKTLKEILIKGSLTYTSVNRIDREKKNLKSNLGIVIANERVKTQVIRHRSSNYETRVPEIEKIEIDSQSDYSDVQERNNSDYDIDETAVEEVVVEDKKNLELVFTDNVIPLLNEQEDKVFTEPLLVDEKVDDEPIQPIEDPSLKIEEDKFSSDDEVLIKIKKPVIEKRVTRKKKSDCIKNGKEIKKKLFKKPKKVEDMETEKFKAETKRANYLNPKNWLTVYLSEEEAEKSFKAKAEDPKFLKSPFRCYQCYKGFSKQDMLDRHTKLRHSETLGPIECKFCHMRFKWKCFLNRHMPRHYTIYKCLRCNLTCTIESSAVFHEDYHNGVIRKCKHCGEEFRHSSTYYTHLRTHRSQYLCTLCGVSFVSEAGLHLHKLAKHIDDKPSAGGAKQQGEVNTYCERCDIKFETKEAFEEHLFHSDMHSVEPEAMAEDVPAPACPKVLRRKGTRTPRKPTTCSYCGKVFPTQAACMKHHHSEHPRTPFFPNEPRHICEICGVSLAPVSIQSHLNTHTRERLYTCTTCGVVFNSKSSWTRHQLTHTGEKPFACSLCDKRFTQSNSVKLHYKTFHLKEPYPKRNRRKKGEDGALQDDFRAEAESESLTLDRWR
ncbi:oocyte zinc finger protein XlCOF6 isoform X1 [Bombyx mori]|uniref:Uncharacterized protein n=1 Tax=Bombyx mori TaxID=7091 RepID=A0A8R1WEW8_BOMMO|nr:oocyte zinc finger protein XlCOF6 isoform X1 [Bombyx mori]